MDAECCECVSYLLSCRVCQTVVASCSSSSYQEEWLNRSWILVADARWSYVSSEFSFLVRVELSLVLFPSRWHPHQLHAGSCFLSCLAPSYLPTFASGSLPDQPARLPVHPPTVSVSGSPQGHLISTNTAAQQFDSKLTDMDYSNTVKKWLCYTTEREEIIKEPKCRQSESNLGFPNLFCVPGSFSTRLNLMDIVIPWTMECCSKRSQIYLQIYACFHK
ncbi:PREDICTED: uncharacterized protein LOC106905508 [Poecilia mexicana]|uniref:uncharacterized protein LOC106905508 n=1 Tax=Poecilia mexicana TaxID=48701 RepID=UPI00072DBECC|nr:PREDICTED: uncharacterized protein LOC106905508 [Poecilia mexicana]